MTFPTITPRQLTALKFIVACINARSLPPTLREIGKHMSIRSTNGVNDHLLALERKGYIHRDNLLSRGIFVTAFGRAAAEGKHFEFTDRAPVPCVTCGKCA